jgi:hypothetical protein
MAGASGLRLHSWSRGVQLSLPFGFQYTTFNLLCFLVLHSMGNVGGFLAIIFAILLAVLRDVLETKAESRKP